MSIFSEEFYVRTGAFQLPLFEGAPPLEVLNAFEFGDVEQVLDAALNGMNCCL